jgi:Skp family chaperone for outer membrane proteins
MSFENDYKKIDEMLKEFKGSIGIARASLQDKKNFDAATVDLKRAVQELKDEAKRRKDSETIFYRNMEKRLEKMEKKFDKLDKIYDWLMTVVNCPIN